MEGSQRMEEGGGAQKELFWLKRLDPWAKEAPVKDARNTDSQVTHVFCVDSHRPSFQAIAPFQPQKLLDSPSTDLTEMTG